MRQRTRVPSQRWGCRRLGAVLISTLMIMASAGCFAHGGSEDAGGTSSGPDESIAALLPADVKSSGSLTILYGGPQPPFYLPNQGTVDGVSVDIGHALADLMGVKVEFLNIGSLPSLVAALDAGRADLSLGPWGDNPERQKVGTFVDWMKEKVAFLVSKDNPKNINGLDTVCGSTIALLAGGQATVVMQKQSDKCVAEGKPAVDMQTFQDWATAALAVSSGRVDAYFSSVSGMTYYAQRDEAMKVVGADQPNGFGDLPMGAIVKDDSGLQPALQAAFERILADGTYDKIMDEAGLGLEKVETIGVNLGK